MEFQNFLERLIAGDVRSFIVLGLLALFVFIIYSFFKKTLHPYQGFIKFLAILLIGLAVYTWITNPDRTAEIFNNIVNWITERVEPLFINEDDSFLD